MAQRLDPSGITPNFNAEALDSYPVRARETLAHRIFPQ
jgi:hypothetical protein